MDPVTLFFATAAGWFTLIVLRIASWIYQFSSYGRTFGQTTNISLDDLAGLAADSGRDVPAFHIVVPAYQEALVIDGTLRRLAALNFPRTHFTIWAVTYADEEPEPGVGTTRAVAEETAARTNAAAGRELVRVLSVPAGFDGRFPGSVDAPDRFVGKPRGLNYAIREIHEQTERDERRLYAGRMVRLGHADRVDRAIAEAAEALAAGPEAGAAALARLFAAGGEGFVGPCALSEQVHALHGLLARATARIGADDPAVRGLRAHVAAEAPRFFVALSETGSGDAPAGGALAPMQDRAFLHTAMRAVEAEGREALAEASVRIEARLAVERPHLWRALQEACEGEEIFQCARRANARWMAVYDADADAPIDLLRHLAARILTEPDTLGFQGPVAPIANYDDVHPLCRIGGMYMAFFHHTGYPRLFARRRWAHILAGTNWCFRMDAFRSGDRLVRDTPYDERARTFILSFDPGHLTEDLEVAVRMFDSWGANAQWHPCVEYEQVPASRRAMVVQRRRWSLGTLGTIRFMLRSRLPLMQKVKYALRPVDIAFSGSGPVVSVMLWILVYTGDLLTDPVIMAWSVLLTVANVVYVIPYLQTHRHFVMGFRRASGVEHLLAEAPALAERLEARLAAGPASETEAARLRTIAARLEEGLRPGGALAREMSTRCRETAPPTGAARALAEHTPTLLQADAGARLCRRFRDLAQRAGAGGPAGSPPPDEIAQGLAALDAALQQAAGAGPWRAQRRREIRQIWLWAFVYLFWQLVPGYLALKDWLTGRTERTWVKTPRTRKTIADTAAQRAAISSQTLANR